MWRQILTIGWAQWRVLRNHLPRTTFGSLLLFSFSVVWYGGLATLAIFIAFSVPGLPLPILKKNFGPALMLLFIVWQLVPLITLSGGWSLDLKKLQVYPIRTSALLATEACLRISGSVEMVLVALGATAGLVLHPNIRFWYALALLLYIPFNLLVSVSVREFVARMLHRNRMRELITILFILIAVLPQFLVRLGYMKESAGVFRHFGNLEFAPWTAMANLALGTHAVTALPVLAGWLLLAYWVAQMQLAKSLRSEEPRGSAAAMAAPSSKRSVATWLEYPARLFSDPVDAIITKEIRTLLRMPRFRVVFTLATVLTAIIILPVVIKGGIPTPRGSSVSIMECYGIVILGDALLWNIFGFDGKATQLYFAAPVDIALVFRGKNIAAALFVCLQMVFLLAAASVLRLAKSPLAFGIAVLSAAVLTIYFMSFGNISSVIIPRGIDPRSTMKKQAGAKVQFWLFGCMIAAALLIGFGFLAGWALDSDWATVAVLAGELGIGVLLYRFSIESAIKHTITRREELLTALSKSGAPVSS